MYRLGHCKVPVQLLNSVFADRQPGLESTLVAWEGWLGGCVEEGEYFRAAGILYYGSKNKTCQELLGREVKFQQLWTSQS